MSRPLTMKRYTPLLFEMKKVRWPLTGWVPVAGVVIVENVHPVGVAELTTTAALSGVILMHTTVPTGLSVAQRMKSWSTYGVNLLIEVSSSELMFMRTYLMNVAGVMRVPESIGKVSMRTG